MQVFQIPCLGKTPQKHLGPDLPRRHVLDCSPVTFAPLTSRCIILFMWRYCRAERTP